MIKIWKDEAGKFAMSNADFDLYEFVKVRKEGFICMKCRANINKGFICMGKNNIKYCLNCADKVIDNTIKSLQLHINTFNNIKTKLRNNKEEYEKNNMAESLSSNG